MKSKWIFWTITAFIACISSGIGFVLFRNEPIPFWVIQCIAILSLLLATFIYHKLVKPYHILLSGMQLLKDQDFSTHLRLVKNKDANELIGIFNRMISQLRSERLAVREKNQFLDLLIHASPQGIIILNFDKQIVEVNPSGLKLLNISDISEIKGKTFNDSTFELAPALGQLKQGDDMMVRNSVNKVYRCIRSSFIDQGFNHPFILIEEITHELLKIEKDSYERIIRMMSHEVNNSVGAIGSTLNVVADIFKQDGSNKWEYVLPAIEASFDRCGHLASFISNLAQVIRIPEPTFSLISLNEQARSVYSLTSIECRQRNIELSLSLTDNDQYIHVDGIQFEQVLVNIIKNAYEAIGENGRIKISTHHSPLSIIIEDNGPGISEEAKQKLFTPFFTTKSSGQGIGLMFVREVLTNHRCRFSLSTEEGYTWFKIFFPTADGTYS